MRGRAGVAFEALGGGAGSETRVRGLIDPPACDQGIVGVGEGRRLAAGEHESEQVTVC